ncbi:hypothetical protein Tco_0798167 [Tanacetum coccineum]
MKKKFQIMLDEEVASKLQAEFDEEERLAREKAEKEKEANVALTKEWDDIQAKIEADHELSQRLHAKEQEELREEEQTTNPSSKRKNHGITLPEEWNGNKLKDLKNKSFDFIQKMFDRAFKRVNTFVDFRTDLVEDSSKRAGEELEQESTKKQKVDEDKDTTELQSLMEVILDEEELAIDAAPLAIKSLIEYGVSTSIGYGVSSSLSNTAYSSQQINTAYPLPLDTAYRSSGTETEIIDFRAKKFLPSFGTNPTDCLSLVSAAAHWLRNEPTSSIKTKEDLKTKFLNKYCPPGQTAKNMEEINNFQQECGISYIITRGRFLDLASF